MFAILPATVSDVVPVILKVPLIFVLVVARAGATFPQEAPRPLVRVELASPQEQALEAPAKEFDPAIWTERLMEADLDAREKSYGNLLRRAEADPAARAFLEHTAGDASRPELAWTARLALRELGRGRAAPFDLFLQGAPTEESMRRMLAGVVQGVPGQLHSLPFDPGHLRLLPIVPPSGTHAEGRNVRVQQTPGGARVIITETIEGKQSKREFAGRDLQEILEQNPELAQELDLSVEGDAGGFRLEWKQDLSQREPPEPFFAPSRKSQALRTDVLGVVVSALSPARAQELGAPSGLVVHSVSRGTIASLLQVRAGDVLLELNARPLARAQDITEELAARPADGALALVWIDELGQRVSKTWRPEEPK